MRAPWAGSYTGGRSGSLAWQDDSRISAVRACLLAPTPAPRVGRSGRRQPRRGRSPPKGDFCAARARASPRASPETPRARARAPKRSRNEHLASPPLPAMRGRAGAALSGRRRRGRVGDAALPPRLTPARAAQPRRRSICKWLLVYTFRQSSQASHPFCTQISG